MTNRLSPVMDFSVGPRVLAVAVLAASIAFGACGSDGTQPAVDGGADAGPVEETDAGTQGDASSPDASSPDASSPDASASPSCAGCGASGNEDCCASIAVPGGTFNRTFDGIAFTDSSYPATVSAFRLDEYEVTVGRFRAFLEAGGGTKANAPAAGSGAHPSIPGSGWDPAWNAWLPPTTADLKQVLSLCGDPAYATWTELLGANESKPMSCLTWFLAFAFCAWDDGRLPTEAEWNYAAAGGSEQRMYPWSPAYPPGCTAGSDCIDKTYAVYSMSQPLEPVALVGSKSPKGDGKWGHADLAGNLWEWALDSASLNASLSDYPVPCSDCANLSSPGIRVLRGGSHRTNPVMLRSSFRNANVPTTISTDAGARCARAAL
jgi:sulfatase modifying factor 1